MANTFPHFAPPVNFFPRFSPKNLFTAYSQNAPRERRLGAKTFQSSFLATEAHENLHGKAPKRRRLENAARSRERPRGFPRVPAAKKRPRGFLPGDAHNEKVEESKKFKSLKSNYLLNSSTFKLYFLRRRRVPASARAARPASRPNCEGSGIDIVSFSLLP